MEFKWDQWQQEVLDHQGSLTIRAGRQVGKSQVVAEKIFRFAMEHEGSKILILAASERQSSWLYEKTRGCIEAKEKEIGKKLLAGQPTQSETKLTNGTIIYSLPAGRTAYSIRGITVDLLVLDEAAYIPEMVYDATLPMIMVSRQEKRLGWVWTLSTPLGKSGYFYHTFSNPDVKSWHVSAENCPRISKTDLANEKKRMTKAMYKQEWCGEFIDEWNQLFPSDLIRQRMTFIEWDKDKEYSQGARYYLGVDVARYGGDENAFVIVEMRKTRLKLVKCITTARVSTMDSVGRIVDLDRQYNFRKIFIDDAGVGGAVTDSLVDKFGRRVLGLNNASKRWKDPQREGDERLKGILKEDLYSNMLMLLETAKLDMISDMDLMRSLKSITYEYGDKKSGSANLKIFGDYSHLTEAAVRACWCVKEKGLDLYIY